MTGWQGITRSVRELVSLDPQGADEVVAIALSSRVAGAPGDGNVSLVVGGGEPLAERRRLLAAVGADLDSAVIMHQVHGADVAVVGRAERGRGVRDHGTAVGPVDALVTFEPGIALVVHAADCVPLLLHEEGGGVAAVHAGRRGVAAGVVFAAVERLTSEPPRVRAVVGPAIGGCCYEVPAELAEDFAAAHHGAVGTTTWGTPSIDLPEAVMAQLARAGVGYVETAGVCTRCSSDRWFSHRADPGAGRQAAVIVRTVASALPDGVADLELHRVAVASRTPDHSVRAPVPSNPGVPFLDFRAGEQ